MIINYWSPKNLERFFL